MSDRVLLGGALVPMVCGVLSLGFLQRGPASELPVVKAAPTSIATPGAASPKPPKPWVGVVIAGSTAELLADGAGRIARVFVRSGRRVAAGDKLLQFDQADVRSALGVAGAELGQHQSDVARAEARFDSAKSTLDRLKVAEPWLSQQELDTARAQARVAQAELSAARASVAMGQARYSQQRLRADRHTLVAPFAGTVMISDLDAGDSVQIGQVLARVYSDDRAVRFAVPRASLKAEGPLEVTLGFQGEAARTRATVSALRPEVDPSAQLVFATAVPHEKDVSGPTWMPGTPLEVLPASAPETSVEE